MPNEYEKITEYKDREFPDIFRELPTLSTHLDCTNCGTPIKFENVNMDKTMAKCHNCEHVFPFEDEVKDKRKARRRAEIFQPEGIEMFRLRSELNIDYKWRKTVGSNYFMLFFTLMWNAMILPAAFAAVTSGEFMALIFMSVHIAVGVYLLLGQISKLINSTSINVDENYLTIENKPISNPLYPSQKIPVDNIDQLYVRKRKTGSTNGVANYGYAVILIEKRTRREIPLITGMKNSDKALFIEQEIEYFLDIDDRRVRGEFVR